MHCSPLLAILNSSRDRSRKTNIYKQTSINIPRVLNTFLLFFQLPAPLPPAPPHKVNRKNIFYYNNFEEITSISNFLRKQLDYFLSISRSQYLTRTSTLVNFHPT